MSWLDDLHGESIQSGIGYQAANPGKAPEPSFNLWSFGASGVKGIPAAGLEMAGSWADLLSAYGTVEASMHGSDWLSSGDEKARQKMLTEGSFDFAAGNVLRKKSDEFGPDPLTAHRSDQVMFGLTKNVGKAVGYMATMGAIPGAAVFGADQGNTEAQRLMEKGVDPETAAKVGVVSGVIQGGGAMLPIAGQTVTDTALLAIFGGPGLYAAQEKIARDILQRQYPQEAAAHDPSDPLGLALSLAIPGIAAGLHVHSLKTEKGVKEAVQLTPAEAAREAQFERSAGNIKELQDAIKAERNPENKLVLQHELDKLTREAEAHVGEKLQAASRDVETVDAARVKVQEAQLHEVLPDTPTAREEMLKAADALGAGERPEVPPVQEAEITPVSAAEFRPAQVEDSNGNLVEGLRVEFDNGQGGGGVLDLAIKDGRMYPTWVDNGLYSQPQSSTGGIVRGLYERAIAEAESRGLQFTSDDSVTPAARGIYTSLRKRGYDVQQNPAAREAKPPEVVTPRLMTDDGSPVFTVKQKAAPEPRQQTASGRNSLPPTDQVAPQATPSKTAEAPAEEGIPPLDASRLQSLATEMPDLKVSTPGGEVMSLADALQSAKDEATALKQFGELVKAAAECALTEGAI